MYQYINVSSIKTIVDERRGNAPVADQEVLAVLMPDRHKQQCPIECMRLRRR